MTSDWQRHCRGHAFTMDGAMLSLAVSLMDGGTKVVLDVGWFVLTADDVDDVQAAISIDGDGWYLVAFDNYDSRERTKLHNTHNFVEASVGKHLGDDVVPRARRHFDFATRTWLDVTNS